MLPPPPWPLERANATHTTLTWLAWLASLVAVTVGLLALRTHLGQSHIVLVLLLVVLGGSATGGRRMGIALALAASLVIDYFFQSPYDQFSVGHLLDGVVLVAFLAVAQVTTELLQRARTEARVARARAAELAAMATERDRMQAAARAADELREAHRAKDAVLAAVSHDLRTPITTIRALVSDAVTSGDATALGVEEQAIHLARLVTQLLDFARIRAGSLPSAPEINMVEDLLGAVVRRSSGEGGQRRVVPHIALTRPALAGRFDFEQTVRILGNLVDNALRYSAAGGVVERTKFPTTTRS